MIYPKIVMLGLFFVASSPGSRPPQRVSVDVEDVMSLWHDINEPFESIKVRDDRVVFTFKEQMRRKYLIDIDYEPGSVIGPNGKPQGPASSTPGGRAEAALGHNIMFSIPNEVVIFFEPLPGDLKASGFVVSRSYGKATGEGRTIESRRAIALLAASPSGEKEIIVMRNDLQKARRILEGKEKPPEPTQPKGESVSTAEIAPAQVSPPEPDRAVEAKAPAVSAVAHGRRSAVDWLFGCVIVVALIAIGLLIWRAHRKLGR